MRDTVELPLAKAINAGLRRALESDPHVMLMGEDIGSLGGVFRVTDGLALAERLDVKQPIISQQLRILRNQGLIRSQRENGLVMNALAEYLALARPKRKRKAARKSAPKKKAAKKKPAKKKATRKRR